MATALVVKISRDVGVAIDGLALLALAENAAQTMAGTKPAKGDGTAAKPFELTSAGEWLWAIKNYKEIAKGRLLIYLNVAGRLIGGKSDCYVSDYGPVWRKGVDPVVEGPAPLNPGNGVASAEALERWQGTQKMLDPTYQTIAQRVHNPALIFNTPEEVEVWERRIGYQVEIHGVHEIASDVRTWTGLTRTPLLLAAIRKMLQHKSLQGAPEVMAAFRQYSRLQRLLPPLVGAMFLAEPARNIRAWPINMMLLDLVQAGNVFGPIGQRLDWVNTIWHPLALDVSRQNPTHATNPVPGAAVFGPAGEKPAERNVVQVPRLGKLHLVGGAMPASPTGGGKFGKIQIEATTQKGLATFLKQRKFDYIHQKEIDVLLHWLGHVIPGAQPADTPPTITYDQLRNPSTIDNGSIRNAVASTAIRISSRIGALDAM